ncbi:hypothetical protein ACWGJT_18480 [Streptomyces xantholiticus]|uniref:Uncharacterized protein n=1 Tax=Streptomyces xantholiticus TaxID=68285 RepID=A0ABV1UUT8_9ACTN
MLTANRLAWFAIAFAFAVPSMLVMFRDNGVITRDSWIKGFVFAATIAAVIAAVFGKGSR